MEEHANYAVDFIRATRWIKESLPQAKISGGVGNVRSVSGNNVVREAMHSAFLYHAIKASLDMGIENAGMLAVYEEVPRICSRWSKTCCSTAGPMQPSGSSSLPNR